MKLYKRSIKRINYLQNYVIQEIWNQLFSVLYIKTEWSYLHEMLYRFVVLRQLSQKEFYEKDEI